MLVLTRKAGQKIVIDGGIEVVILSVHGPDVRIGVAAPRSVHIRRDEAVRAVAAGNRAAAGAGDGAEESLVSSLARLATPD